MLDDVLEMIFELALDGAVEAAGSKRVPWKIRVALIVLLLVLYLGFCIFLFVIGLQSGSIMLEIISVLLLLFLTVYIVYKARNLKNDRDRLL